MLVFLSSGRGCNEVGDGLGKITVVFCTVAINAFLDVFPLFSCGWSAGFSSDVPASSRTVIESRQANLQSIEGGESVFSLQRSNIHIIIALHPHCSYCLEPCWQDHFHVVSTFGDIAVFGTVRVADDEMRHVRSEVQLNGRAHLGAHVGKLCLCMISEGKRIR